MKKKCEKRHLWTVFERRQLDWGPDVALTDVWAVFCLSGVQCVQADCYLLTTLRLPISKYYFLIKFNANAYLHILRFH